MLDVIDEEEWRETVKSWLMLSRETPSVIYPLLPFLLGSAKQEINVSGEVKATISILELRKLIGAET